MNKFSQHPPELMNPTLPKSSTHTYTHTHTHARMHTHTHMHARTHARLLAREERRGCGFVDSKPTNVHYCRTNSMPVFGTVWTVCLEEREGLLWSNWRTSTLRIKQIPRLVFCKCLFPDVAGKNHWLSRFWQEEIVPPQALYSQRLVQVRELSDS